MTPADRLAELVDPEVLGATIAHLEHMRAQGAAGQIRWNVDPAGIVQVVEVAMSSRRKAPPQSKCSKIAQ